MSRLVNRIFKFLVFKLLLVVNDFFSSRCRFIPPEDFNLALLTLELEFVKKGTKSEQVRFSMQYDLFVILDDFTLLTWMVVGLSFVYYFCRLMLFFCLTS